MLQYSFMQNALIIALLISILCPSIGIFLVVRRHSMIGDTMAHSSLAGVALGLIIGTNPIMGAFVFTSLSGVVIELFKNYYKKYSELILTIIMSLSIGIALTLISSGTAKANVNSYLFGSILTVSTKDLITVLILCAIALIMFIFLFNKLLYIIFDEEGASVAGLKVKLINYFFSILVAASVSVSIRIVGVLVITSMISLPVATALQFEKGFKTTLLIAVLVSIMDTVGGLVLSYYIDAAAGGVIALTSVITLIIVLMFRVVMVAAKRVKVQ
ncbi:metal ABC transporter permease [Clostridium thermarum]|uniref:metal ABC transporter permease n=1 Tax=Clostridium thermarum TaxID=1716543 RepID=UPI0013D49BBD|nr:metal ABC transporter permease [Clostridium thermarum]